MKPWAGLVLILVGFAVGQICDKDAWFNAADLLGESDGSYTFTYVISGAVRSTKAVIQARIRPPIPLLRIRLWVWSRWVPRRV